MHGRTALACRPERAVVPTTDAHVLPAARARAGAVGTPAGRRRGRRSPSGRVAVARRTVQLDRRPPPVAVAAVNAASARVGVGRPALMALCAPRPGHPSPVALAPDGDASGARSARGSRRRRRVCVVSFGLDPSRAAGTRRIRYVAGRDNCLDA
jgi:hypothetical protein